MNGVNRKAEKSELWAKIVESTSSTLGHRNCKVEATEVAPDGKHIAVCLEIRTLLGLKLRRGGLIYSIEDNLVVGRIAKGKRENGVWVEG